MERDAIDFPCSPLWVSHYASRGLTQDYPPSYYEDSEVYERISALEQEVQRLTRELAFKDNQPKTVRGVTV